MEKVVLIPGLDDRDDYTEFREILGPDFNVVTHTFGWQDRKASPEELKDSLLRTIDGFTEPVPVVGVSAGGAAAVWALLERPEKVSAVYNVCGALRQPRKSFLNILYNPRFEGHFDHMLELIAPSTITNERLLSVRGRLDGLVRRSSVEFGSSRIIDIPAIGHPFAIAYALRRIVPALLMEQ